MRTRFYFVLLFAGLFSLTVFCGQGMNGKAKKIMSLNNGRNSITLHNSINSSFSNAVKNLSSLIRNQKLSTKSLSQSSGNLNTGNLFKSINSGKMRFVSPDQTGINNISKISWNDENGTPRFLQMKLTSLHKGNSVLNHIQKETSAINFLIENKTLLKIKDPANEFLLEKSNTDNLGMTHVKFSQVYNGLEVWGDEIIVHLDSYGNVVSVNGDYEPTPNSITDINGVLTSDGAISQALYEIRKSGDIVELSQAIKSLLKYNGPSARKIIWFDKFHQPHLSWVVEVRSGLAKDWFYFIDAVTSGVLNYYNRVCFDGPQSASAQDLNGINRTVGTYQVGSNYFMIDASQNMFDASKSTLPDNPSGSIIALDIKNHDLSADASLYYVTSSNNQWGDPASVSANYNAVQTYQYYLNVHNRNSIDGSKMNIYSIIHATENNQPMENAFWSGTVMCYGDGGSYFKPLAGGLDVAAHEMTHGVTQYTANLEYQNQSGALNESISDVFGVLVDSLNWTMGENIIKDYNSFPSGALRDMADPHNGGTEGSSSWQPAKMSEFRQLPNTEDGDWGGVHTNSGIPNHAFYLAAQSIGRFKAGKIWYRALTVYLTRLSQFIDARIATEKAAADLFGESSDEYKAIQAAWDGVEVFEGSPTQEPPTSEINGDNWILVINTDPSDPNSIYMVKTTITSDADLYPLTQTTVFNRPAVTDGSGLVLFIDTDNNLRALVADPQNTQEEVIEGSNYWWSVAAGPGLNSIALTSKYSDTTIYYYDFSTKDYKEFKIVAKAYDGQDVKTALYADALSFDPTGQYILFDCYNEIKKSDGSILSYWTIDLLDVQTGYISNVFPPQQEGISVGNPAFSKTAQNRFTFDYEDDNAGQFYVMAADFNTGNTGVVNGPQSVLGYPTYSGDDKIIAYHTDVSFNGANHEGVRQMPLQSDLITGTGSSTDYLVEATYPFWFVIGTRVTEVDENSVIPSEFVLNQNYPNPFNPETVISFELPSTVNATLKIYDILGREVATLVDGEKPAGTYSIRFNSSKLSSGIYFYQLAAGNYIATKKMLVVK